jgi:hypothetical protein
MSLAVALLATGCCCPLSGRYGDPTGCCRCRVSAPAVCPPSHYVASPDASEQSENVTNSPPSECSPPDEGCEPRLRASSCLPRLAGILHRYKAGVPSNQHAEYTSPLPKFHPVPTHPVFEPLPAYSPLASLDPKAPASKALLAPTPAAPPKLGP